MSERFPVDPKCPPADVAGGQQDARTAFDVWWRSCVDERPQLSGDGREFAQCAWDAAMAFAELINDLCSRELEGELLAALEAAKPYVACGGAHVVKTSAEGRRHAGEVLAQVQTAIANAKGGA